MDLNAALYVDLTIKMIPTLISKLTDTFSELQEELENYPEEEALKHIFKAFLEVRTEIGKELLPEGITSKDMVSYKKKHKAEIEEYLVAHPEIKHKLDELKEKFKSKFSL